MRYHDKFKGRERYDESDEFDDSSYSRPSSYSIEEESFETAQAENTEY